MRGLWTWVASATVVAMLAGCGGGGGGTSVPPITREGVSVLVAGGNLQSGAQVVQIRGGAGPDTLYVEEGAFRFLGTETRESDAVTRVFRSRDGLSVARLATPTDFRDIGLLRLEYRQGGTDYVSNGVLGRFTRVADMPRTGSATFSGGFAEVRWIDGDRSSDLIGGSTSVVADFEQGTVAAALDFDRVAGAQSAPVDLIELGDMQINGNRFSGGTLSGQKNGTPVAGFSTSTLVSSGVFAGPGAAELGGVFYAEFPEDRLLRGRYLARR